jgi:hypothetical protein
MYVFLYDFLGELGGARTLASARAPPCSPTVGRMCLFFTHSFFYPYSSTLVLSVYLVTRALTTIVYLVKLWSVIQASRVF